MAEHTVVVTAYEQGYACFTENDCRKMRGNVFPITDASGRTRGFGTIIKARLADSYGAQARITFRQPDELEVRNTETDTGRMVRPPILG